MQKIFLFLGSVSTCAIGAFFLGATFAQNINATQKNNIPAPTLSDIEKAYSENPDNIMTILSETRSLLAGSTKNQVVLKRSRLQLERATAAFYQKHLDEIALSLYLRGNTSAYREAFQQHKVLEIKADISQPYASRLKKSILNGNINPKNREFRAYAYILGRLHESPKSGSGGLDTHTLEVLKNAEKGSLKNQEIQLGKAEMQKVFEELGYLPWRQLDLKTMRKIITTEGLSIETQYTRAYVTAQMLFGRNALGNRIYLRNTLVHKKQIASLSCEANSTAHFYNYYAGLAKSPTVTEKEVFDWFPIDDRLPKIQQTERGIERIWGDPDKSFVGKVEGRQSININQLTGYGIHAKGIEPILQKRMKLLNQSIRIENFNEMNIVFSLANNHPVLFWYVLSDDPKKGFARLDWTTWDGANTTGYIGEHTGIIVGVELDKGGNITKVGYYEGLSEGIIWEAWDTLKTKAKYFDSVIVAEEK